MEVIDEKGELWWLAEILDLASCTSFRGK